MPVEENPGPLLVVQRNIALDLLGRPTYCLVFHFTGPSRHRLADEWVRGRISHLEKAGLPVPEFMILTPEEVAGLGLVYIPPAT